MRIVFMSDTHGCHEGVTVPDGDVFIHAGDFTARDSYLELYGFGKWLAKLPHKHKIFVAGNHDWIFERDREQAFELLPADVIYLQDSAFTINGVKFYGTPAQPVFCDWAFNIEEPRLTRRYQFIDDDTNVLITHTPPYGVLDETLKGEKVGSKSLKHRVKQIKPKLHLFGHIHESYGKTTIEKYPTRFYNGSICDDAYCRANAPWVIEI